MRQAQLRVRATCDNHSCFKKGDEFIVHVNSSGHLQIECRDSTNGPEHGLLTYGDRLATSEDLASGNVRDMEKAVEKEPHS